MSIEIKGYVVGRINGEIVHEGNNAIHDNLKSYFINSLISNVDDGWLGSRSEGLLDGTFPVISYKADGIAFSTLTDDTKATITATGTTTTTSQEFTGTITATEDMVINGAELALGWHTNGGVVYKDTTYSTISIPNVSLSTDDTYQITWTIYVN